MMTTDKKLAFLHKMAKLGMDGIPHYDAGGTVSAYQAPSGGASTGGILPTISNALGLGNTYQAAAAPVTSGTNPTQVQGTYENATSALGQQEALQQQASAAAPQALGAQAALSNQLAQRSAGQGPNPAQEALNQSTGRNISAQAALQASQRGASANPGAVAVNAAQQGADIQQQAAGQAATLQAQQQIAAQQQQAQLAAQQFAQAQGATQAQTAGEQNQLGILEGANSAYNNTLTSGVGSANAINAQTAQGNQQANGSILGGIFSGAAAALGGLFAHGGEVQKMAEGGFMSPTPLVVAPEPIVGPTSVVGQFLNSGGGGDQTPNVIQPSAAGSGMNFSQPSADLGKAMTKPGSGGLKTGAPIAGSGSGLGGDAAMGSAGTAQTAVMNGQELVARGGVIKKPLPPMRGKNLALVAKGGQVKADGKGERAISNHDDYANDKVPALLSEGEVVIDKNTLNDPGPVGKMARAVAQHIQMRNSAKGAKRV